LIQFLLYCFCGGIGVTTDYLTFCVAIKFGVWYQAANISGYVAGTLVSFFLNRRITFGVRDQWLRRLSIFLGVAALGYLASALMLWLMVGQFKLDPRIAKLATLPVVVMIQFLLNRRITFNQRVNPQ